MMSNFSISQHVFYLFGELSAIFIEFEIVICKPCQFGRGFNLSFGKGLILFHKFTSQELFDLNQSNHSQAFALACHALVFLIFVLQAIFPEKPSSSFLPCLPCCLGS